MILLQCTEGTILVVGITFGPNLNFGISLHLELEIYKVTVYYYGAGPEFRWDCFCCEKHWFGVTLQKWHKVSRSTRATAGRG